MTSLLLAFVLAMPQGRIRTAVVFPIVRLEEKAPEAERWNTIALRAEGCAEALLRHHGFQLVRPKELPTFDVSKPEEARITLRKALDSGVADVVVGIRILNYRSGGPSPYIPPVDIKPHQKEIDAAERIKPEYHESSADVCLNLWLQMSDEQAPFIYDKKPGSSACGVCSEVRLLGDAAQKCIEAGMARFIRIHGDGRPPKR